jgi:phage gp16-like protein
LQKSITKEQIKYIKTIQRRHQPDDDEYREMLEKRFGVTSCTQLTCAQAGRLIDLYITWGWASGGKRKAESRSQNSGVRSQNPERSNVPRQAGNMVKMVSPAQQKKIGALADLIEWRVKDGLTRWVAKRFKIDKIKTAQQAWQVIEGLKKMFERQMEKQHGPGWRDLNYNDSSIKRYIGEH